MTRIRSRLAAASAALTLSALVLVGCAGEPPALEPSTAEQLQSSVLEITEAAADGDLTQARSLLSGTEAHLRTAAASGQVTPKRSEEIQAAINLVSSDLTTAIEAADAKAAEAAQARADAEAAEAEAAEEAEADQAEADQAAADAKAAAEQAAADAKAAEDAKAADEDEKDSRGRDCKKDDEDCND